MPYPLLPAVHAVTVACPFSSCKVDAHGATHPIAQAAGKCEILPMSGGPTTPDTGRDMEWITELRHALHRNPELSNHEGDTARRIAETLKGFGPTVIMEGFGGTGVAAVFAAPSGEAGPTVLLRAELDALPIAEARDLPHASRVPGVSHKCGHDGHMAILTGVASRLAGTPPPRGRVVLLFQPAEETGEGAARVTSDPRFTELSPDYVFALHNLPGHPLGSVISRSGTFAAASTGMTVTLEGRTAHAAEPERGLNPAGALSRIMQMIAALPARPEVVKDRALATIVSVRLGERAFGISPGAAELMVTLRAFTDEDLQGLCAAAEKVVADVAVAEGLDHTVRYDESFPTTVNDPAAADGIRAAARGGAGASTELGPLPLIEVTEPFRWSEDFAHFLQRAPGALFGLGAGPDHAALHAADYDFPDELLPVGIDLYEEILRRVLEQEA